MNIPDKHANTQAVADITGLSIRQLQWWDERKLVSPQKEAHRRVYKASDVFLIAVLADLRAKGFSLQRIRPLIAPLSREITKRLAHTPSSKELFLLTDGEAIHFEDGSERVVEVLRSATKPMFLISVSEKVRQITQ